MTEIFDRTAIEDTFAPASWQRIVFSEFEATLTGRARPFPCVFGVTGFKANQLRFAFADPLDADATGGYLMSYLKIARTLGRMTSLVVFARPGPVQHLESYRQQFWQLLASLERSDPAPRPAEIASELDTPSWEFCYGGEPFFVVCNTPAHVLRQSRRSTSFTVTFQPRWVFEGITDSDDPAVLKALASVRDRLSRYDAIDPAPYLGSYGDPENREYQQYFIDDTNDAPVCPYRSLGANPNTPRRKEGKVA